jgi:hypothetical protein
VYGVLQLPELPSDSSEVVDWVGVGEGGGGGGLIGGLLDQLCHQAAAKASEFSNADLATFAWSVAAVGRCRLNPVDP